MILDAPVSGEVIALGDIPDPVFSQGMVGYGSAISPFAGGLTVISPCAGTIKKAMPHSSLITCEGDIDVLVHLGIDTFALNGEGFTEIAHTGTVIGRGQALSLWNTSVAEKAGLSLMVPVVAMGVEASRITLLAQGRVEAGKPFLRID